MGKHSKPADCGTCGGSGAVAVVEAGAAGRGADAVPCPACRRGAVT